MDLIAGAQQVTLEQLVTATDVVEFLKLLEARLDKIGLNEMAADIANVRERQTHEERTAARKKLIADLIARGVTVGTKLRFSPSRKYGWEVIVLRIDPQRQFVMIEYVISPGRTNKYWVRPEALELPVQPPSQHGELDEYRKETPICH